MNLLTLDFESYYDDEYTLKKMPTMQYIRDPRWQCKGAALCTPDLKPVYIWPDQLDAAFKQINWRNTCVIAHNAPFDAAVLWHHYRQWPAFWFDTWSMARYCIAQGILPPDQSCSLAALTEYFGWDAKGDTAAALAAGGEQLAGYARHDAYLGTLLFNELAPHVPPSEQQIINLHVQMASRPHFRLNKELLREQTEEDYIPPEQKTALGKNELVAQAYRRLGVEPMTKTTPKGNTAYAFAKTDTFMQQMLAHPDRRVRRLTEMRLNVRSTIRGTRAQRFLDIGEPLPVPITYYGAHTGRGSGTDNLNMQNLPREGRLRKSLMAPEGYRLVILDSAQMEVRGIAWLAGEQQLLDQARASDRKEAPDVYAQFAGDNLFGLPATDVSKEQRNLAKPPMLACGFGMGTNGLIAYAANMGIMIEPGMAERAVAGYRNQFRQITEMWKALMHEIREHEYLQLPSGRKIQYPDLYREGRELYFLKHKIFSKSKGKRDTVKLWHGLAAENLTQAAMRDVIWWQTLLLLRYKPEAQLVLQAHDEIVLLVPEDRAEDVLQAGIEALGSVPSWAQGLPMRGEGIIAEDYGVKP